MSSNTIDPSEKLRRLLNQNQPVTKPGERIERYSRPVVKVTLTENTDEQALPLTVRQALERAYSMYHADYDGSAIYATIEQGVDADDPPPEITDEDKSAVDDMLNHYRQTLWELKMSSPESLSDWSSAISKLVAVPDRALIRKQIPLVVSLPRFRHIDLIKSRISSCHENIPEGMTSIDKHQWTDENPALLRPVEIFEERNSKRHERCYVWTVNQTDPIGRMVFVHRVDGKNLEHTSVMDYIFATQETVKCKFRAHAKDFIGDFKYFDMRDLEFVY